MTTKKIGGMASSRSDHPNEMTNMTSGYAFTFQDAVFTPDGKADLTPDTTSDHNAEVERAEIDAIKSGKLDRLFLYVKKVDTTEEHYQRALTQGYTPETTERRHWQAHRWSIGTWLGTHLAWAIVGSPRRMGFGWSTRRHVTVDLFGTLYHGWYYESSGDYCRLKRAKKQ